jgi:hypothetical protein
LGEGKAMSVEITRPPKVDPVRLVSWVILAGHEGVVARSTDEGSSGFGGTWCGNVAVDIELGGQAAPMIYRVHRGTQRAIQMGAALETDGSLRPMLHAATWVEPDSSDDVMDPRQDR